MFEKALADKLKAALGEDTYPGLMGMFLFLHFYYSVPIHGLQRAGLGLAAVVSGVFFLSFIAFKLGNRIRSAIAFTLAALAVDFFYRGVVGQSATTLVFEYLSNGSAVVNFASFGFASAWMFSQLETAK
jgi:hypothetical protein